MILTTTPGIQGKNIVSYQGIVFGEVISGVNFLKDFNAREQALAELEQRAMERGANAVVGIDIDYEVLGTDNGMLMVTASGTAVIVE